MSNTSGPDYGLSEQADMVSLLTGLETEVRYLAGLHPQGERLPYSPDRTVAQAQKALVDLYRDRADDPMDLDWVVGIHVATLLLGRRDDSAEFHYQAGLVEASLPALAAQRVYQRDRFLESLPA